MVSSRRLPRPAAFVVEPPTVTDVVEVGPGRVVEYAEFGDPDGHPVLWLHGTPGSCRQVAPAAKQAAVDRGIRIIGVARPGVGRSTFHPHRSVLSVTRDLLAVPDHLGLDDYAVIGLSGGGPYALATSVRHPDRVRGVAVLGGVPPTRGVDGIRGGLTGLAPLFEPLLRRAEGPIAWSVTRMLRPITPWGSPIYDAFSRLMPEGDRRVFAQPGVKDMFIDDLSRGIHGEGLRAALHDAVLFGRHWGFRLDEVRVPVHWWHGDADSLVGLGHGEHATNRLPDATFVVRPGDSHLSGYAAADDVIGRIHAFFEGG